MINKSTPYFALAQILITLAGYLFLISIFLWDLEKTFAIQGTIEKKENLLAWEKNESQIKFTSSECFFGFCSGQKDWFEQSVSYNLGKLITFWIGVALLLSSILFWFWGYEEVCQFNEIKKDKIQKEAVSRDLVKIKKVIKNPQ